MSNEEHRQQWPSRLSFILAAMGSSIGLGNLLRYPSVAWANWGSQWFIPYVLALFFIGIPLLLLEIAMGQSYRSSNLVALGRISPRFRGLGLATIVNAYVVATYYNVIIAWAMVYLGRSFESPLPWAENAGKFFEEEVIRNVGETIADSNGAIIWATWAATVFIWACVFLFLFKGVDVLGKIVYVTMGVPVFMLFVLVARGVTLDNASDGIHLYIGVWRGAELWKPVIWQDAVGQIFFSIGAGFGVFTAYARYL
jgi:solute carrier family 6 GABA transporter-like protein 1